MSSDLSEIVIRMATEEDYDGVIGIIPNLYDVSIMHHLDMSENRMYYAHKFCVFIM